MKRILAGLLVLSMLLVGCGKNEKAEMEGALTSYLAIAQGQDHDTVDGIVSFFKDPGVLKDANLSNTMNKEGEETSSPKTSQAIENQMINSFKALEYTIDGSTINDDKTSGSVTVTFKYKDMSTALKDYLVKGMQYVFSNVNSTQTDEQLDAALANIVNEAFEKDDKTEETQMTVDMVKDGDKWLIKEATVDIVNVLTAGLYSYAYTLNTTD